MNKKSVNLVIIIIFFTLLLFLGIFSYQAINIHESWKWSVDYKNEKDTIQSYGALASVVVSLISAILLVYTIFTQFTQFQTQLQSQKDQFEEEKKMAVYEEKKDMYFQLLLVNTILISYLNHLKIMSKQIKDYFEAEQKKPLLHFTLLFDANSDAERLNKMESLKLLKAFQYFFEKENDDWVINYNNLFGQVTFYHNSLNEILENNQKHLKDKYDQRYLLSFEINDIIFKAKMISIEYRKNDKGYKESLYYQSLENLVSLYSAFVKPRNQEESDLEALSNQIFLPFLRSIETIFEEPNKDKFGIIELAASIATIRKKIEFIKFTSISFTCSIEETHKQYYIPGNISLKKLESVQDMIGKKISALKIDNL